MDVPAYLAIGIIAFMWLAAEALAWYRAERRRH